MLSRSRRISKTEFKNFERGIGYHSLFLSLILYKKLDDSPSQFSFLCSKKTAKDATTRNLLRRRGYASIRGMLSRIRPGYYCVFSFKKGANLCSFREINEQIDFLLKKSGIL